MRLIRRLALVAAAAGCGEGGDGTGPGPVPGTGTGTPLDTVVTRVTFSVEPSEYWSAGSVPRRAPRTRLLNTAGATVSRAGVIVQLSIMGAPAGASLTGATVTTGSDGVAAFDAITLTAVAGDSLRLVAAVSGVQSATSAYAVVLPSWRIVTSINRVTSQGPLVIERRRLDAGDRLNVASIDPINGTIAQPFAVTSGGHYLVEGTASGSATRIYYVEPPTAPRRLTLDSTNVNFEERPVSGPDAAWAYFIGGTVNRGLEIYRVHLDGSGRLMTAPDGATIGAAGYSVAPDGLRLAYVKRLAVEERIFLLDLGTGQSTDTGIDGHTVRWSPTGEYLAFLLPGSLEIVRLDGTGRRTVAPGAFEGGELCWSPDGRWLIARTASGLVLAHLDSSFRVVLIDSAQLRFPACVA